MFSISLILSSKDFTFEDLCQKIFLCYNPFMHIFYTAIHEDR